MQAGKRYTLFQTVNWTRRYLITFLILDSIPIALVYFLGWDWLIIPWQPIALIGIAVAFYLGFKNNSSYERLWEARKIWGGIVNASRSFTVQARDFITNEHARVKRTDQELASIHKTIVHRHVAWLHALAIQLRKLKAWEHDSKQDTNFRTMIGMDVNEESFDKIKPYISESEFEYVMSKGNRASHLLSLQSKHLLQLKLDGLIEDFRHMEMMNLITEFYTLQGKSERIKNFPFPRQYATANFFFVCIFLVVLPFSMMSVFANMPDPNKLWLAVPFSVLASWVFWIMESIGEYSENPFEGLYNDVPISSIATGIEIDIRQMLEETDLPSPVQPIGDMKILT